MVNTVFTQRKKALTSVKRFFWVPAARFEPTSSEPESDILSIELRRHCGKNTIFLDLLLKKRLLKKQPFDNECTAC